ncbi:MAG TPA: ROK family protein [Patescibacteria group bacterium]|nr:ROK family protein [Patescibacteria group bacterium]
MLGVKTAALPASLRRTNQRTVISLLLRLGSASRADLAKAAGISQPTAGKITTELLRLGILQEAGSSAADPVSGNGGISRLGRPGQLLRLDGKHPRFLAIELGVTETCLSVLPIAVELEDCWAASFPTAKSPNLWLENLKEVVKEWEPDELWGILVSVPGIVDEQAGKVLFSPNLHWLEQTNLPELLRTVWGLPVLLVQEIRALALGHLTAEPGGEDFLLLDFGQGVGGAVVLDGELFSHPIPLSGEVGHTPVAGNLRRCGCGARGCLETLVSEGGLLESFAAAAGNKAGCRLSWSAFASQVNEAQSLDPWLQETLDSTGRVVAGALNVLGIRRLVITGRLADLPACVSYLSKQVKQGAMWGRFGEILCQVAPHRRAAGLVAAGVDRLVLPSDDEAGAIFPPVRDQTAA